MCVGIMRTEAGRDPHDRGLQDLVGELSTRSETFRRLWADHNVRTHGTGTKRFHHPVVGELTLAYEELAITAEPGLVLSYLHRRARLPVRRTHRSCSRPGRHLPEPLSTVEATSRRPPDALTMSAATSGSAIRALDCQDRRATRGRCATCGRRGWRRSRHVLPDAREHGGDLGAVCA